MKLTRENIYINLQGKSKEELTELWEFLTSIGEKVFRDNIEWFLEYSNLEGDYAHLSYRFDYTNWGNEKTHNKQEVTIQQLKEILKPMESLQEQLEKAEAEAEVKRLKEAIEESKIKVGDLVKCKNKDSNAECIVGFVADLHGKYYYGVGGHFYDYAEKIQDQELINKLNKLIK